MNTNESLLQPYQFSQEQLEQIAKAADEKINAAHQALNERTKDFAQRETYENITEFAYEQVLSYINNPEELKKILSDAGMFQTMYQEISEKEPFDEMADEELKHFPHVLTMTVIAGSCAFAVREAIDLLGEKEAKLTDLYQLEDRYVQFQRDAMDYANGKNKNVGIHNVE